MSRTYTGHIKSPPDDEWIDFLNAAEKATNFKPLNTVLQMHGKPVMSVEERTARMMERNAQRAIARKRLKALRVAEAKLNR